MTNKFLNLALAGLSAVFLAALPGCSFEDLLPQGGLKTGAASSSTDVPEEGGLLDSLADEIVAAGGPEERALRVCFFSAVAGELMTYRLTYHGAEGGELESAFGAVSRLQSSVARIAAQQSTFWFETEMFYAVVGIVRAIEGPLRDRAIGAVTDVALLDWKGLASGLRKAGGQGLLAGAMVRDAQRAAASLKAQEANLADAWAACQGRIDGQLARLQGALGIAAPRPLGAPPGG